MARRGSFSRGGVLYGVPLSLVHPIDNRYPPQFIDDITGLGNLTLEQMQDLQDRVDDLYESLKGERDYSAA